MALIQQKTTPYGVDAHYHKIDRVMVDAQLGEVVVIVTSYLDHSSRISGNRPLVTQEVKIPFHRLQIDPRIPFYDLLQTVDWSAFVDGTPDVVPTTTMSFGVRPVQPPPPIVTPPPDQE